MLKIDLQDLCLEHTHLGIVELCPCINKFRRVTSLRIETLEKHGREDRKLKKQHKNTVYFLIRIDYSQKMQKN